MSSSSVIFDKTLDSPPGFAVQAGVRMHFPTFMTSQLYGGQKAQRLRVIQRLTRTKLSEK